MNTIYKSEFISLFITFLKKGIHFLYHFLLQPKSTDEDVRRKEFILNIILVGSISLLSFLALILVWDVLVLKIGGGIPMSHFFIVYSIFLALLVLSRKGYTRFSSLIIISIFFIGNSFEMLNWGVNLPVSLLMCALVIIMSSVLISSQFGIYVTVCSVIVISLFRHLEVKHFIHVQNSWKFSPSAQIDAFIYSGFFLAMMLISWLSNREIEKSLFRAHKSEKELKDRNESLEQIIEERTQLLRETQAEKVSQLYRFAEFGKLSSGIFHDLMNPLSIVSMNVNQLETSIHPDVPDIKNYVGRAVEASKKLEDFMGTVRKQIKNSDLEERFLINKEIKDAILLLSYKATKMGVIIKFRSHRDIFTYGSPIQFQHVISNLISNAVDAYESVNRAAEKKCIIIKLTKKEHLIKIKVEDNGCGIPEHVIDKIFDPFFTTKENYKGMGIGLSNTKEIITKYFGDSISVVSKENEGSQFTLTLPLRKTPHYE